MKWEMLKAESENHGATWIHTRIQMKADQIPRGKELRFIRPTQDKVPTREMGLIRMWDLGGRNRGAK